MGAGRKRGGHGHLTTIHFTDIRVKNNATQADTVNGRLAERDPRALCPARSNKRVKPEKVGAGGLETDTSQFRKSPRAKVVYVNVSSFKTHLLPDTLKLQFESEQHSHIARLYAPCMFE